MNIYIIFRDRRPSESLAWFARRSLAFALDRFAPRIGEVSLRVADINGPKGGVDQACTLAIQVAGGSEIYLRDVDSSPERCVHRLARRAVQAIARTLGRKRSRGRR
jgi:hypothetical protein